VDIFEQPFLIPPSKSRVIDVTEGMVSTIIIDQTTMTKSSGSQFRRVPPGGPGAEIAHQLVPKGHSDLGGQRNGSHQ
jgi:hypothetical protein